MVYIFWENEVLGIYLILLGISFCLQNKAQKYITF